MNKIKIVQFLQIVIFHIGCFSIYALIFKYSLPYPLNSFWGQFITLVICFVIFYWITTVNNSNIQSKELLSRYAYLIGKPSNAAFIEILFLIVSTKTQEDDKQFLRQVLADRIKPIESSLKETTAINIMNKLKSNNIETIDQLIDYLADNVEQISKEERNFYIDLRFKWEDYINRQAAEQKEIQYSPS